VRYIAISNIPVVPCECHLGSPPPVEQNDSKTSPSSSAKKKIITAVKIILMVYIVSIPVVFVGVQYLDINPILPPPDEHICIMRFSVEGSPNESDTVGCFFRIRAEMSVDIDPRNHTFWISEEGDMPVVLNFSFRDYSTDTLKIAEGGDRNATYRYDDSFTSGRWADLPAEEDRERWTDGEYIGFDMPTEDMGIDIVSGNNYEVLIKNPENDIICRETFKYQEPWSPM